MSSGARVNVGSLFSGIGGLDHGLARAGFRHRFFCESDPWRRGVLAQHWPGVPIYEDVHQVDAAARSTWLGAGRRTLGGEPDHTPDHTSLVDGSGLGLLCGGFPCQDVSVAGQRRGLAGNRSGLFFEFARIIGALRPGWVLVENVPGLLSSNGGRDFGAVVGTLADLGYGVAWRVLDSRFFGVPQRRRRVFVVGTLADSDPRAAAERAGQVLAVGTRCPGHPPTGHQEGQDVAPTLGASVGGGRGWDANPDRTALIAAVDPTVTNGALGSELAPLTAASLSHGSNPNSNAAGRRREDDVNLVGTHIQGGSQQDQFVAEDGVVPTLAHSSNTHHGNHQPKAVLDSGVRRLTPTECERLQALPDGWTAYGPDSRRYAALGDAVTASVAEWIGRRILQAAKGTGT